MDLSQLIDQFNLEGRLEQLWRYGEIVIIFIGALLMKRPLASLALHLITLGRTREQFASLRQTFLPPLELAIVAAVVYVSLQFVTFEAEIVHAAQAAGSALMVAGFWAAHRGISEYSARLQKMYTLVDAGLTQEVAQFITQIIRFVLVLLGTFSVLDFWGVNLTALLGGMGILGAAVAFASQDVIKNVFGSLVVLMDKTYQVGDSVQIGKTEGVVEHIGLRTTTIRDEGKSVISIPNSTVVNTTVHNYSRKLHKLIQLSIFLDAKTPTAAVQGFLQRMRGYLATHEWVSVDEVDVASPAVSIKNITDRGVEISVVLFMKTSEGRSTNTLTESIYLKAKEIAEVDRLTLA